jgi:AraC-like DNA-binding protein
VSIQYREHHPTPPLNRYVECFWTLTSKGTPDSTAPERILPDGCVELILNFGDRFSQYNGNNKFRQPRKFLVGQMTGPILISPTGVVQLIGIRFHPGGTLPFLRLHLNEITDQVVELGSVSSNLENELLTVSDNLPTIEEKVVAIESLLLAYLLRNRNESLLLPLAARVVESGGLVSVDLLADEAGLSTRQLERRFLREVGLSPKLLSRILRFQQVFRAVERCDGGWAPVAVECGYYDQAHLKRDFNQFAHQTPAVLFAEQSALTESFTRKTRKSDFSNTLL